MLGKERLKIIVFLRSSEPRTKGLYAMIRARVAGMLSMGMMVLERKRRTVESDTAARLAVASLSKKYPRIIPVRMKQLNKRSDTRSVVRMLEKIVDAKNIPAIPRMIRS